MFCEQCGKQIADGDAFCPECGWKVPEAAPVSEQENVVETAAEEVVAEAPVVEEVTAAVEETVAAAEENVAAAEETVAEVAAETAAVAEEVKDTVKESIPVTSTVENSVWNNASTTPGATAPVAKAAKKMSGKTLGIIIGAAAVVVLLLVAFLPKITHAARATFSSPEKYYSYIEGKQVEETLDAYMSAYDVYVDALTDQSFSSSGKLTVELGEDLRDLAELAQVDISWLESVNFAVTANMKGKASQVEAKVGANKVDILSANAIIDFDGEEMYLQVPELNKKYLGVSFEDADMEYDEEMFEVYDVLKKYIPDTKDVNKLLSKYIEIALKQVEDVDKKKTSLKVGDVTQKCTALEVTIDTDTLQNMAEAVLEAMEEDKDLEKMIIKTMGIAEEMDLDIDPDDAYDMLMDEVGYALDNIEDIDMGDEEIVMTVYVNGDGNIIGREVEVAEMKVKCLMPRKGSKFEAEISVEVPDYDETVKVTIKGSGKVKGDKMTGDFTVKAMGISLCDIRVEGFDMEKAKKSELVGKFTFTPSKAIATLLTEEMGSEAAIIAPYLDYSLEIDVDSKTDGGKLSVAILDEKEVFVKVSAEGSTGKGSKISIPSDKNVYDAMDEDDIEDWLDEVDWEGLIKQLEKANVESDYIDMLEDLIDELD